MIGLGSDKKQPYTATHRSEVFFCKHLFLKVDYARRRRINGDKKNGPKLQKLYCKWVLGGMWGSLLRIAQFQNSWPRILSCHGGWGHTLTFLNTKAPYWSFSTLPFASSPFWWTKSAKKFWHVSFSNIKYSKPYSALLKALDAQALSTVARKDGYSIFSYSILAS